MKNVKTFEGFTAKDTPVNEAKNTINISFRFNDSDDAATFCDAYGIRHKGSNYAEGEVDVKFVPEMLLDLTEVYGIKTLRAD